ncbi:quinolinate phosphoribosyl transferase [Candidatus Jorgensenbacteria bacterium]|nr:quinolinate phosphoribosyl transferase [Candidatus Jorgensenbacteria bacterium]
MDKRNRLPITTFDIATQKIRRGYYSAVYFWREKQILEKIGYTNKVLMQVFQKNNIVLCGVDEAIAILKTCSGFWGAPEKAYKLFDQYQALDQEIRRLYVQRKYQLLKEKLIQKVDLELVLDSLWMDGSAQLVIEALHDGDRVEPWETMMTIDGLAQYFAHLESVYLGILARRTLVATNVARVVEAAQGKPILFFADRFDHYSNQTGDGYAAMMAGATSVATDDMGEWWGKKGIGTMPHALIACFNGDTVEASLEFAKQYPDIPCISLVDFDNDCSKTALDVADRFAAEGLTLYGVRLDTSEAMVDESIIRYDQLGQEKPTGVTPTLARNVRQILDAHGYNDVKIFVSGGFSKEKIEWFERVKAPVDGYGCGSSLLKGSNDFTADIVLVRGRPCSKKGRLYRPNPRLEKVD